MYQAVNQRTKDVAMHHSTNDIADTIRPLLRDGLSVSVIDNDLLVLDPVSGEVTRLRCDNVDTADTIAALRTRGLLDHPADTTTGLSRRTLISGAAAAAGTVGVTVLTLPAAAAAASPTTTTIEPTTTTTTVPISMVWTSRTSAADNNWTSVTYGNGLFVAVADSGTGNRVMTSPDGITWTARTSAADNSWRGVTYGGPAGGELFVAVASSGIGNRVMTSTTGT